jgi:uncharacterized membrane protein
MVALVGPAGLPICWVPFRPASGGRDYCMTGWVVGIVLGVVVIAVAAAIVITIVMLAMRIAKQAETAVGAVDLVRKQTTELGGIARINDSGVRILHAARALRKVAVGK